MGNAVESLVLKRKKCVINPNLGRKNET